MVEGSFPRRVEGKVEKGMKGFSCLGTSTVEIKLKRCTNREWRRREAVEAYRIKKRGEGGSS